jgi:integrase
MSVYWDQKWKNYRYDFMHRRRRYTKRGFETKRAARDAEHDHRVFLKKGRTDPFPTFKAMVGAYLNSSQRTKTEAWCYQLEVKLNKGFPNLADLHPREITRGHIEPVLDRIFLENAAGSANEYRKIIISVFNYGVEMSAVDHNPAAGIPRVPEEDSNVPPIPKAHLMKLILAADDPQRRLYVFLSQTAGRFEEARRLHSSDIVREPRPVCVLKTRKRRGGGEKRRVQPLTQLALETIQPLLGDSDEFVFRSTNGGPLVYRTELGKLHRLCDRLEIPHYGFHQIRHWTGAVATSMGRSKKAVAKFLGQADTGATERYMHAADPELWEVAQRLEAEIGGLPREVAQAQFTGVNPGVNRSENEVAGVNAGVNSDGASCSQTTPDVRKSIRLRRERWPSGLRRTPAKRVWG